MRTYRLAAHAWYAQAQRMSECTHTSYVRVYVCVFTRMSCADVVVMSAHYNIRQVRRLLASEQNVE